MFFFKIYLYKYSQLRSVKKFLKILATSEGETVFLFFMFIFYVYYSFHLLSYVSIIFYIYYLCIIYVLFYKVHFTL